MNALKKSLGVFVVTGFVLAGPMVSLAQTPPRAPLSPHLLPATQRLPRLAELDGETPLRLAISLPGRDPAGLAALLREQYSPGSPRYHQFLAPGEFAARFGAAPEDYAAIAGFARTKGLTITRTHGNQLVLSVAGPARAVQSAFHLRLHRYQHPREGRTFFAPDREPALDLTNRVLHISGLDDFSPPRPRYQPRPAVLGGTKTPAYGSGPGGSYRGYDFRNAYVPGTTLTGAGQSVALLEFDGYSAGDIAAYVSATGLPGVNLTNVAVAGGVGSPGSGAPEVCLDIELAASMAPGLANLYVYEAPLSCPWVTILSQIADDNLAASVSCSWGGGGPDPASELVFQQMAAQGQSFFNATGDDAAFTGAIPFPSESTNIVQVGATTLTTTGGAGYVSESAWNWGGGWGTGGGVSTSYGLPGYQAAVNMATNGGSTTWRNVPDVAMVGDNVYVYTGGAGGMVGGTSCAAPLWAAFTALANQQAAVLGRGPVGFLNPALYAIGTGAAYGTNFHDVTAGDNTSPDSPANYYAVPGYDLASGWGSPNGTNLLLALASGVFVQDAAPGFSPGPGTYYSAPTISLTSATTGATIRYTTDGSLPSETNGLVYSGPFLLTNTTLLQALAYGAGGPDSAVTAGTYTVIPCAFPTFTNNPVNLTVCAGGTAAFTAGAAGTGIQFQWQIKVGAGGFTNLPAATNVGYTTPVLNVSASGNQYQCLAIGVCGTATSAVATLTVPARPTAVVSGGGAICPGGGVSVQAALTGTGPWSVTWSDGSVQSGVALSPAVRAVSPVAGCVYTVTALADANCTAQTGDLGGAATVTVNLATAFTVAPVSQSACAGGAATFTAAAVGTGLTLQWQINAAGGGFLNLPGATNASYTTPTLGATNNGAQYCCVAAGACGTVTSAVATLAVYPRPTALVSGGGAVCPGGTVTLSAALSGTAPWRVTWSDGVVQTGVGASPAARTITPAAGTNYTVTALLDANCSAQAGDLTGVATVTLNTAPAFTTNPVSIAACAGSVVVFTAAATGTGVGYQWQLKPAGAGGFTNLAGATNAAYATPVLPAGAGGNQYLCLAPGACGTATSAVATLTVRSRPTAGVSGGGTICAGGSVVVQAALTGTSPWQVTWSDGAVQAGVGASPLSRTVSPGAGITYTVTNLVDANCTAQPGDLTGSAAVTVQTPPSITTPPASQSVAIGANVTFTVAAAGSAPLAYQWLFNGARLAGATNSSLALTAVATNQAGAYSVTVTNTCGTITSAAATLTVSTCGVPSPWVGVDVGTVGLAGGQCYSGGTYTLQGSGTAMTTGADQFHYVYQSISGNGSIVVQLNSEGGATTNAYAGVMLRELTANYSREVCLARQGTGPVVVAVRQTPGNAPTLTIGAAYTPPNCWLQLVRSGSTYTASVSTNGTAWTTVKTGTISMATGITIGLVATSGSNTTLANDVFSNVTVVP